MPHMTRTGFLLSVIVAVNVLTTSQIAYGDDSSPNPVIVSRKACATGCGLRGNCNYEEGRCECPWGYTGPACEIDRMAVCRQTPQDPGSCGLIFPKNCECYRECYRLYCHYGTDTDKCVHSFGPNLRGSACWLYGNNVTGPADRPQNSSLYPEDPEHETLWYDQIPELFNKDVYTPEMLLQDDERRYMAPWHRPTISWHMAPITARPLSACPNRCADGRGVCIQRPDAQQPACLCHVGFQGKSCSKEYPEVACWFSPNCSGRGRCVSGFCHCQDGYWGMGCHRSTAYQPAQPGTLPDVRFSTRLKIYRYEVPWETSFPYEPKEDDYGRDPIYTAYELFLQYFLTDEVVQTENPYEANMFYIPALAYFYSGNVGNPQWQTETVINYVRQKWPFYNRTDGADHFVFMTGDRGPCLLSRWLQDSIIKVAHFGLQRHNISWQSIRNKDYGCIQVKRDLVVPPTPQIVDVLRPIHTSAYYEWLKSTWGYDGNRTLLLMFAGGLADPEYSGGVRQAAHELFLKLTPPPPDVRFVVGHAGGEYPTLLKTTKFCIAPYGHGWGNRLVQAVYFGCIPLIIQDGVYQAFEDFLPYDEFSVRMPLSDVPHMVEILRSYSDQQLAVLRLGLAKWYSAFIWNREYGGRAYEWTLAGLQRRLEHVRGEYFHHHHHLRSH